jgi:hypothetical protein
MGVYSGIAQDNATINSGNVTASLGMAVETVAAAGSGATTAASATTYGIIVGTGADGTKGIKLPTAKAGKIVIVKNADAANAVLKVYPATDDKINSGTATTGSLNMAAKTSAVFVAISDVDWFTVPLLPS